MIAVLAVLGVVAAATGLPWALLGTPIILGDDDPASVVAPIRCAVAGDRPAHGENELTGAGAG
jgi:hypothetical protein